MRDDPSKKPVGDSAIPSTDGPQQADLRVSPRYPFVAVAKLTELSSGTRSSARTSDLSLGGCYIDTLNPFPVGSLVRLQFLTDKGCFEALAKVAYVHARIGMGLVFTEVAPAHQLVLDSWLAEIAK